MPATERLYYIDSHLIEFEARVVDKTERVSGWTAVTLDRTAFYPTGGGQPSDTGTLAGTRVLECIDDEQDGVLHVIQGKAPEVGATVKGRIDWPRRLDHIQQHTGQHILSQAFVTLFNAPTRGFRVMDNSCEIDVELMNPTNELIERAIELANNVIWEDRQITIKSAAADEAARLPLRKEPSRAGELRLIEIEGFDLTPCGGTHAYRTGEVGMIAMRSWERAKGLTRIEFVAGGRALADYRRTNNTAHIVASLFSAARDDAAKLAAHMLQENKELHRRVRLLEEVTTKFEAEEMLKQALSTASASERGDSPILGSPAEHPGWGGTVREDVSEPPALAGGVVREFVTGEISGRVIAKVFDDRDAESLKHLALALIAHPHTVALLGSREKGAARLVFARSEDAFGDMNALMREACAMLDGRGGGKPDMAQGGGKNIGKLDEAIDVAARALI